jgi:hypothetical protein
MSLKHLQTTVLKKKITFHKGTYSNLSPTQHDLDNPLYNKISAFVNTA